MRQEGRGAVKPITTTPFNGGSELFGVDSGRGQDDALSAISVSPDDICDGVFRDAEVAGDPSV